jgi:hypothetical protein
MDGAPAFLLGGQDWKDFLTPDVTVKNGFFDTQAQCWQRRGNALTVQDGLVGEIFADQFVGWVYEKWDLSNDDGLNLGHRRSDMMNGYMPMWIKQKLGLH